MERVSPFWLVEERERRGERIELRGFGVFIVKPRKSGVGRNPRTGEEVAIPPGKTIRFKPGGKRSGGQDLRDSAKCELSGVPDLPSSAFVRATTTTPNQPAAGRKTRARPPGESQPIPPETSRPGRREWVVASLLLAATLWSTMFAGLSYAGVSAPFFGLFLFSLRRPEILLLGLPFSITFIAILLAHELGHYFACRRYAIRCTLPYFLPLPISIAGTLGAFIRIRSPFPGRRALFDVGIAGPLAGFALVIPALIVGIGRSRLIPKSSLEGSLSFGEPLIFRYMGNLVLGYSPDRQDMIADPIAMAAWFGLLATSLNLLPIWQLDGGHIAYAVFGRNAQRKLSVAAAVGLIAISFLGWPIPSYLVFGLLLLILGWRFRFYHPPTMMDWESLGNARLILALLALAILVLSFTPIPISVP